MKEEHRGGREGEIEIKRRKGGEEPKGASERRSESNNIMIENLRGGSPPPPPPPPPPPEVFILLLCLVYKHMCDAYIIIIIGISMESLTIFSNFASEREHAQTMPYVMKYSRFPVGCPKIATRIRACAHLGGNFE